MTSAQDQLVAIGFGRSRREPHCWHIARVDGSVAECRENSAVDEPAGSAMLLRWRDLLAARPLPPAYRISRA